MKKEAIPNRLNPVTGNPVPPKPPLATKTIRTPEGTIRVGQRKPFKKCNERERNSRIERVAELLLEVRSKEYIARTVKEEFGLAYHMVRVYIAWGKEYLQKRANITPDKLKELATNLHLSLLSHEDPKIRIKSEERLELIHGYGAPRRIETTGVNGGPILTKQIDDTLDKLSVDELRALARASKEVISMTENHQPKGIQ